MKLCCFDSAKSRINLGLNLENAFIYVLCQISSENIHILYVQQLWIDGVTDNLFICILPNAKRDNSFQFTLRGITLPVFQYIYIEFEILILEWR